KPPAARPGQPAPNLEVAEAPPEAPPEEEGAPWGLIIFFVLLLIGGIVVAVVVVNKQNEAKKKAAQAADEGGNTICGYRLEHHLQSGQASQVWEVVEVVSSRHFAMKILLPEKVNDEEQRHLLLHEAE